MSHPSHVDFLIAGAGITGLTLAFLLKQAGKTVRVIEQGDQPGGAIRSVRDGDWLAECGAGSILESSEHITRLIKDANLENEVVPASAAAQKRYLVKNGQISPVPASVPAFMWSGLLSRQAKWQVLREPFIKPVEKQDEALANFVRRRLGHELLDQFVNPLVGGIYAGDPEQLSVRHGFPRLQKLEDQHGSLIKGQIKGAKKDPARKEIPRNKARTFSFQKGVQTLPLRLAELLGNSLKLTTAVDSITHKNPGFEAELNQKGTSEIITADQAILTIPAHSLGSVSLNGETGIWEPLTEIPYAPLSVINLGFHQKNIRHPLDGFGVLIPEKENYRILGVQFNSTVFEARAPENHAMLTVFLGGMRHPTLPAKPGNEQIDIALHDLRKLLGIRSDPEYVNFTNWQKAIPQYEVGYHRYLHRMKQVEEQFPGLHLAGNYRGGIAVGDCVVNAFMLSNKVAT